jgi:hypothetical protein
MAKDPKRKAIQTKEHFERIVGALMRVPKDEADAIMEAEKKPRNGEKRGRKAAPGPRTF